MKRCNACGRENSDDMNFCVECGTLLAGAPMVVNIQGKKPTESFHQTDPAKSVETRLGIGFKQHHSRTVQPPKKVTSKGPILFAIAGILALILLLIVGVGAIVSYNIFLKPRPSPYPSPAITPAPTIPQTPGPSPLETPNTKVSALFEKMWVDFDVNQNGKLGMHIHLNFKVDGLKDDDSAIRIYFLNGGNKLKAKKTKMKSQAGYVALFENFKPKYDSTHFEDFKTFMPYDDLDLSRGKYNLQMQVDVIHQNGELVQNLTSYDFTFTQL